MGVQLTTHAAVPRRVAAAVCITGTLCWTGEGYFGL
jgi:hypothetical protein